MDDGKMCCLGFFGLENGANKDDILNCSSPQGVGSRLVKHFPRLTKRNGFNNALCNEMMRTNDDMELSDSKRIKILRNLFRQIGWKLKFVK
jgi:hypothetical protein